MRKIAIFGGSFNPPGLHHRNMVFPLIDPFDEVKIVPCGLRPDKPSTGYVEPIHRREMVRLAFSDISPEVVIDDFDLNGETFMRTYQLQERYEHDGEIWHVIGTDLLVGGEQGHSAVHTWEHGARLWAKLNFAVFIREGIPFDRDDLPPKHMLFHSKSGDSSKEIRRRITAGLPFADLVMPGVAQYIEAHSLYLNA